MKQNVFLDLGTHRCEGLTEFASQILPIDKTWKIYSFEPNPLIDAEQSYNNNEFLKNKQLDIEFFKKAVWTKTGQLTFKMFGNGGCSQGSLLEETKGDKFYNDYHSSTTVEAIDLWNFITTTVDPTSNLYIKMDVEWAEYELLQDMLTRGWPKNIVTMWIEFHGMYDEEFKQKSQNLIDAVEQNFSTKILRWK